MTKHQGRLVRYIGHEVRLHGKVGTVLPTPGAVSAADPTSAIFYPEDGGSPVYCSEVYETHPLPDDLPSSAMAVWLCHVDALVVSVYLASGDVVLGVTNSDLELLWWGLTEAPASITGTTRFDLWVRSSVHLDDHYPMEIVADGGEAAYAELPSGWPT